MAKTIFLQKTILLQKTPVKPPFVQISLFAPQKGIIKALFSPHTTKNIPDLFDVAQTTLSSSYKNNHSYFLKEYILLKQFENFRKNFESFSYASKWARFWIHSLPFLDPQETLFNLCEQVFSSLNENKNPTLILLKGLFLFAKQEGLPVIKDWLSNLPVQEKIEVQYLLKSPPQAMASFDCNQYLNTLFHWLKKEFNF